MSSPSSAPLPAPSHAARNSGPAFILKKAVLSALVALVLFSLMIGVRTEAGSDGQLTYWTRFGDLAAMVGCTRQSVNKLLGQFTDDGLVRLDREGIVVTDLDGLAAASRR